MRVIEVGYGMQKVSTQKNGGYLRKKSRDGYIGREKAVLCTQLAIPENRFR